MPLICPASYTILALHDEDLSNLHSDSAEQLLERGIDINLSCKFSMSKPGRNNWELEVLTWNNGTTKLCGSCSFCDLLADGIQKNVRSSFAPPWNLGLYLEPNLSPHSSNMMVAICFDKLEYRIDRGQYIIDELQPSDSHCDLYLLRLTGYRFIYSDKMDSGMQPRRVDTELHFELFGEEHDPIIRLLKIGRRPLYQPRLSDQNVTKILGWLRDCDESHEDCKAYLKHWNVEATDGATAFLPTRLIDLGNTLHDQPLRLIATSGISSAERRATRYMALSYCWGPVDGISKLLRTTQATLALRTERIELESMPQTFQDAITVSRKLGIRYLWIDSLCIIQDDMRDWQIESSRMAEIFSNAYLTVIAACGSGCNDSFLTPEYPIISCTVPLSLSSGENAKGQFSLRYRRFQRSYDKMADIEASRHITRGWTFQEERLARRALTFGPSKFFFDCRGFQRAQGTDKYVLRPGWATIIIPEDKEDDLDKAGIGEGWSHWQTLCSHYTWRELTFPQDKLPAISGMANMVSRKLQSQYLAGLWKDNLMHDLFWKTVAVVTRPKEYRAPSWSWASLDGRVRWQMWRDFLLCSGCRTYCTILDASTTPAGLDPYGSVKDGFLKVRGVLREVKIVRMINGESQYLHRLYYEGQEIGEANLDSEENDAQVSSRGTTCQALVMAECRSKGEQKAPVRGLLLGKTGQKRDGYEEFMRLGMFTLFLGATLDQHDGHGTYDTDAERIMMIV
ncbi:heterokaryon incompatibility protein-domain-containing protein [Xylogone sp. PMI_703]|nr:heterokaryon incompatibility protein-domain-containing protein [Xylogone sp. PMI_703]